MTMDSTAAGQSVSPSQPSNASNTDPEFWLKRLNDMKKGADIPTSNATPVEVERPQHTGANVGNTYLLKGTEDSNRTAAQASPSFKEQVSVLPCWHLILY